MPKLSIIIPTFTGEDTIDQALDSVINQTSREYEVIVVIDGPNDSLCSKIERQQKLFSLKKIPFRIHQFSTNKGRFVARKKGAQLAHSQQLLFMDDRVVLPDSFLKAVVRQDQHLVMPDVKEFNSPTVISSFLQSVREKIYKPTRSGYYITASNFESSAKGTGCLFVEKKMFLSACQEMLASQSSNVDLKNVSDDTQLLKTLIQQNECIYKSPLVVHYIPRTGLVKEVRHIYERGPKFVDYYMHPDTRYYIPLMIALCCVPVAIIAAIVFNQYLLYMFTFILLLYGIVTTYLINKPSDFMKVFLGFVITSVAFSLGILRGITLKALKR